MHDDDDDCYDPDWPESDEEDNEVAENLSVKEPSCIPFAMRAELGTGLAKAAIYRCRQRGADDYLTNINVLMLAIVDIQQAVIRQFVAQGKRDDALALEKICSEYMQEVQDMERALRGRNPDQESRLILPDEPRISVGTGELMN